MLSGHAYELISAGLLFTVPYFFSKKPVFDRDNETQMEYLFRGCGAGGA